MILIAAGSSLPFCNVDSQQIVLRAFSALERISSVRKTSSLYETPAWPDPNDPPFINAVAVIETALPPVGLLLALHAIEAGFGRRRRRQNAPRTLDLDLLAYDDLRRPLDDRTAPAKGPVLPHPGIATREFVLAPLTEIAPNWRHPVSDKTAGAMLAALPTRQARRIS